MSTLRSLLRKSWTRVLTADAEIKHKRVCDGLIILFILAILTFGLIRATNEYRWSGWAPGDAQTLSAAQHFADEGFIEHSFLTYYHPGIIGSTYFLDGYYTHSPPLYAIINGVVLVLGGERYECQALSVFLSSMALLFFYTFFCYFFRRPIALVSTVIIGISVVFWEHMDGLSPQTYDVYLVSAAMALFAAAHRDRSLVSRRRLKTLALVGVWLLVFLQAFNSFEYILFLQLFIIGYYFLSRQRPFPYRTIALFLSAPVAAFGLHFWQIVYATGSVSAAWQDILLVVNNRTVGEGASLPTGLFPTQLFSILDRYYLQAFGIGIGALLLLLIFVRFLESYEKPKRMLKFERGFSPFNVLLWLAACFLAWRVVISKSLEIYHPLHALAFVGLLFGLMISLHVSNVSTLFNRRWSENGTGHPSQNPKPSEGALLKLGFTTLILLIPIAAFIANSVSYLSEYPNEISSRTWNIHVPTEKLKKGFEIAEKVKEETTYGDIVFFNLGNELQAGAETFFMFDEIMGRRGFVLGTHPQLTETLPVVDGDIEKAYALLRPQKHFFTDDGMLVFDGLPDDTYLHCYEYEDELDGVTTQYVAGIKNFNYRLDKLRELRKQLIEKNKIGQDGIKYYALLSDEEKLNPLGAYLLNKYQSERISPEYTLIHLDELNGLEIPLPEAYWPLDLLSGDKAFDFSGWDRHLILNDACSFTEQGKVDSAMKFEGIAAAKNNILGLYIQDKLTISFWMYPFEYNNSARVITMGMVGNNEWLTAGYDLEHPHKLMLKTANVTLYSKSDLPANAWTHVAVTLDQSTQTISIYLNGTLDNSLILQNYSVSVYLNGVPDTIQNHVESSSSGQFVDFIILGAFSEQNAYFEGYLDDVAIYSDLLSPEQIDNIFKHGIDKSKQALLTIERIVEAEKTPTLPDWLKLTDMSVTPDSADNMSWALTGIFEVNQARDGFLWIKTNGQNAGYYGTEEKRFSDQKGITAEIKLKVLDASPNGYQGACLLIQDGTWEGKLSFYPDYIAIRDQNEEKATHFMDTTNGFHVYRLCMLDGTLTAYADGENVASITLANPVTSQNIMFGDLSTTEGENFSALIDYLIYSVHGAMPPLPNSLNVTNHVQDTNTAEWNIVSNVNDLLEEEAERYWSSTGLFEVNSVSNNILTIKTAENSVGFFGRFDQNFKNSVGSTAEFTLKLMENSPNEDNSYTFCFHDGTRGGSVVIHPDYISILDPNNEIATYDMDTTADFHTYRLALLGDIFNVYVDGKPVAQIAVSDFVPTKVIFWGDISAETGKNMHAQVSYLAYTATGALTPDGKPVEPVVESSQEVPGMGNVTKLSDMRVLPDSEQTLPWTSEDNFDIKQVLNGILTIRTSGVNAAWFVLGDERFNNDSGTTAEFKIKVTQASSQGFQGTCFYLQDGIHEAKVTFYPDRIAIRDQNDEKATHLIDTTDDFHTYRLAMIRDSLNVYVDGQPVASVSLEHRISSKGILIGDLSTDEGENIYAEIDYIAYQCDSALAPDGIAITSQTSSGSPPLPSPEPSPWTKFSEMNDPPDREDEPWGIWGTFDINNTSEGILTIKTSGANAAWIGCGEDRLSDTKGTTVETRLKLLNAESRGFQGVCLYVQDGTHEAKITFWPNFIIIRDQNDARAYYGMNTLDGFHVYRITMKGNKVDVYVDGSYVATISLSNQVSGRGIVLGDLSTEEGENIHAEVDYIAYSADGAFSPAELPSPISNGESSK